MKYTSPDHRQYVTLSLSFVNEPVTLIAANSLTLKQQFMMQDEKRTDEAIEQAFPADFAAILLNKASEPECEEFFTKWFEASSETRGQASLADIARRLFG